MIKKKSWGGGSMQGAGARDMAEQVRVLAVEPVHLTSVPGTHIRRGLTPTSAPLTSIRESWCCAPPNTQNK